ncbi:restriction endonuclease subunit S [Flavobacterium sp. ASV13]|uniref:restriction endonuclease subunit S n=1 Tax=Flavobacterium sp. ASV13 TaxID=1506583 RepID=UPI0005579246|nr:restriction endonuclease subunit S [Flavobacterium sp. ASV13]
MDYINTTIGEIVESAQTGKTPNTKEPLYYEGEVLWVTPTDLQGQQYISDTNTKISELAILDKQVFLHIEDTVLISCIGDIGKTAIVKKAAASNQQITGIRVKNNLILPKFFYYWIIRNKEYLGYKANKVTIPILNNTNLKKLNISFPKDLELQRKVVSQLDSIQFYINEKIEIIKILEKLIHSLYFQIFGDPVNNQKGFKKLTINQISDPKRGVTRGMENPGNNLENGYPYLTTSNIKGGEIKINKENFTSQEIHEKFKRSICQTGDVILTIRASIGQAAVVTESYSGYNITRGLAIIPLNQSVVKPAYLLCTIQSRGFQFLIQGKVKGTTFAQLNLDKLKGFKIPIPDLKLQEKFQSHYDLVSELRSNVEKSLKILQDLFLVILHNAFKPDVQIDEEPIFKDLIKKFTAQDLRGNKQRLQYLINLFEEQNFDEIMDYTETREILFELMEEEEIIQIFEEDHNLKLRVK